jgi:hypothetical protein
MSECATTVYSETDSEARERERERVRHYALYTHPFAHAERRGCRESCVANLLTTHAGWTWSRGPGNRKR